MVERAKVEFDIPYDWKLSQLHDLNEFLTENIGNRHNWVGGTGGTNRSNPYGMVMLYESDREFFVFLKLKFGLEEARNVIIEIPHKLPIELRMEISNWVGANKPGAAWFDGGGRVIIRDEALAIVFRLKFGL